MGGPPPRCARFTIVREKSTDAAATKPAPGADLIPGRPSETSRPSRVGGSRTSNASCVEKTLAPMRPRRGSYLYGSFFRTSVVYSAPAFHKIQPRSPASFVAFIWASTSAGSYSEM